MAEDKEIIDQIKREHFIMRRTIERIWLMHENAMKENKPLQEKVLWLDITLAIKHTKSRSTQEMGIARIEGLDENKVMFKVGLINSKEKMEKNKKYLLFSDGSKYLLPDITLDEFTESHLFESGSNDTEYGIYLRKNDMHEIEFFNDETLNEGYKIVDELGNEIE